MLDLPRSSSPVSVVVRDATLEIRSSIVFATIIIVLVFLPVFGLAGIEGRLLSPLAFAHIVALLASLAVAIVVTPALCYAFLPLPLRSSVGTTVGWRACSNVTSRDCCPRFWITQHQLSRSR